MTGDNPPPLPLLARLLVALEVGLGVGLLRPILHAVEDIEQSHMLSPARVRVFSPNADEPR